MIDVCFNTSGVILSDFIYFYLFLILSKMLITNDLSTLHILPTFYFIQCYDACEDVRAQSYVDQSRGLVVRASDY